MRRSGILVSISSDSRDALSQRIKRAARRCCRNWQVARQPCIAFSGQERLSSCLPRRNAGRAVAARVVPPRSFLKAVFYRRQLPISAATLPNFNNTCRAIRELLSTTVSLYRAITSPRCVQCPAARSQSTIPVHPLRVACSVCRSH